MRPTTPIDALRRSSMPLDAMYNVPLYCRRAGRSATRPQLVTAIGAKLGCGSMAVPEAVDSCVKRVTAGINRTGSQRRQTNGAIKAERPGDV